MLPAAGRLKPPAPGGGPTTMNATNAIRQLTTIAILAIAISACSPTPTTQAQSWTGTSTSGTTAQPLQVDVDVRGTVMAGTYTIGTTPPFTGDLTAELEGTALTGELHATSSCTFTLTGTLTPNTLEATFTPSDCPGAEAGTWNATPTVATE